MFSEKAFELIKELNRSPDNMPPFNVSVFVFYWKTAKILVIKNIFLYILG